MRAFQLVCMVVAGMAVASSTVGAKEATLTGKVGDAMCGAKHMMANDEPGCTAACVKKGSDYALVVDGKAYTLKASKDSVKADLAKLAGQNAKVTGDQNGDTIQVTSVVAVK